VTYVGTSDLHGSSRRRCASLPCLSVVRVARQRPHLARHVQPAAGEDKLNDRLTVAAQSAGVGGWPAAGGLLPFIVKDNYDTHDMPTTGGSASLVGPEVAPGQHGVQGGALYVTLDRLEKMPTCSAGWVTGTRSAPGDPSGSSRCAGRGACARRASRGAAQSPGRASRRCWRILPPARGRGPTRHVRAGYEQEQRDGPEEEREPLPRPTHAGLLEAHDAKGGDAPVPSDVGVRGSRAEEREESLRHASLRPSGDPATPRPPPRATNRSS
jgi:hypothetical protein